MRVYRIMAFLATITTEPLQGNFYLSIIFIPILLASVFTNFNAWKADSAFPYLLGALCLLN